MPQGVLRVEFVMPAKVAGHALAAPHAKPMPARAVAAVAGAAAAAGAAGKLTELAVGLVGRATESLIDAAALWAQPDVARLEDVAPVDAFYNPDRSLAVEGGCLVFHDGHDLAGSSRTLLAVFQVEASPDGTAFGFTVRHWSARQFQNDPSVVKRLFSRSGERDIALKIEWLSPGAEGVGTRAVFVEHIFSAIDPDELERLFEKGQRLPWMVVPRWPADAPAGKPALPLNLKVTLLETTQPNQLAAWLLEQAKARKADLSGLVQDALRRAADPAQAAAEQAKRAGAADTAFGDYRQAAVETAAQRAAEPKPAPAGATTAQEEQHRADRLAWQAALSSREAVQRSKRLSARTAFDAADLPWPGDLA